MSDLNVGNEPTAVPGQQTPTGSWSRGGPAVPEQTGWVGWIVFGATMMILLGVFHAIQGLVALFDDGYYIVRDTGLPIHVDYTAWGWTHLILGLVVVGAGVALLSGRAWGRVVAGALAFLSAIVNFGFLSSYPIWSAMMITFDVLVLWAITVHGSEMRKLDDGTR